MAASDEQDAQIQILRRKLEETRKASADLVGLSEAEARLRAEQRGLVVRIATPENSILTADMRTNRVTLWVVDGRVTRVSAG